MARKSAKKNAKEITEDEKLDPSDFAGSEDDFGGFESTDEEDGSENSHSSSDIEPELSVGTSKAAKNEIGKLAKKALKENKGTDTSATGSSVVYVGRIPHGFFEKQMKEYFGQFGSIKQLRLSRNKRTGASKHFAFIEFESPGTASIVCDTMDNYLLFGHILKVKPVQPINVRDDLFVGANRKFQAIPWGKVGHRRYKRKHSREWWEELTENDHKRRKDKEARLKSLGIDYTL